MKQQQHGRTIAILFGWMGLVTAHACRPAARPLLAIDSPRKEPSPLQELPATSVLLPSPHVPAEVTREKQKPSQLANAGTQADVPNTHLASSPHKPNDSVAKPRPPRRCDPLLCWKGRPGTGKIELGEWGNTPVHFTSPCLCPNGKLLKPPL